MNDIRFVPTAPGRGELYINGHKVQDVLSVEPNLFETDSIATVTIVLAVTSFVFAPAPKP